MRNINNNWKYFLEDNDVTIYILVNIISGIFIVLLFVNSLILSIIIGCITGVLLAIVGIYPFSLFGKLFKPTDGKLNLLFVSVIFCFICISLFVSFKISSGYYICTINKSLNGINIHNYNGNDSELIIPNKIFNLPIIEIKKSAFSNKNIKVLYLPKTVKTIEEFAFYGNMITKITIGNNVNIIMDEYTKAIFSGEVDGYVPKGSYWTSFRSPPKYSGGHLISLGEYYWRFITNDFSIQYNTNNMIGGTYEIEWIKKPEQPDYSANPLSRGGTRNRIRTVTPK